jgi:hypothetical protein
MVRLSSSALLISSSSSSSSSFSTSNFEDPVRVLHYPSSDPPSSPQPTTTPPSPLLQDSFHELCQLLHVENKNAIRLDHDKITDGVRGVYLNHPIQQGDIILSIPLTSCLVDTDPPRWMLDMAVRDDDDDDGDGDDVDEEMSRYENPSDWATRLAASVLDLQLLLQQQQQEQKKLHEQLPSKQETTTTLTTTATKAGRAIHPGHALWLSILPPPESLEACLPIHWSDDVLSSTKCTALELVIDSAYFTRAQAMDDLVLALRHYASAGGVSGGDDGESTANVLPAHWDNDDATLRKLCSTALDIVQTRSCRLERPPRNVDYPPMELDDSSSSISEASSAPIRVLAPIFDMINHGSSYSGRPNSVNAEFGLELSSSSELNDVTNDTILESTPSDTSLLRQQQQQQQQGLVLVVRATRNMVMDEEVLIDYGPSTRPAWKCLSSYGFVPTITTTTATLSSTRNSNSATTDDHSDTEKEATVVVVDEDATAEVYVDGQRYEVGTTSIPFDMVVAAISSLLAEEGKLGPEDDNENIETEEETEDIVLTPQVVQRLSQRLMDAATYLVQEPGLADTRNIDSSSIAATATATSQTKQISLDLAASLRRSNHQVLLACAKGLLESFPLDHEGTK